MTNLVDQSQRALGKELRIGPLGYGCWRLVNMSVAEARARIEHVLSLGMNLIDTADVYGLDWGGTAFGSAEELLGEVLQDAPGLREQMVLASKGGIIPGVPYDSAYLEQACDDSLRRLGVDCLDLYQIHRPDMLTHPEETARVLQRLKDAGKVRTFGVSNYTNSQTEALMSYLPGEIISQQPQYSALHLDPLFDGTFDQCMQHQQNGIGLESSGRWSLGRSKCHARCAGCGIARLSPARRRRCTDHWIGLCVSASGPACGVARQLKSRAFKPGATGVERAARPHRRLSDYSGIYG